MFIVIEDEPEQFYDFLQIFTMLHGKNKYVLLLPLDLVHISPHTAEKLLGWH